MKNKISIFKTTDGKSEVLVEFIDETFWLTLNQISDLYERDKSVISRHIRNIFLDGELSKNSTVAKNATVHIEANREVLREIVYYNLDVILSVGYRVNSKRGTQFRQWATARLNEYLIEGYTINVVRLKEKNKEIKILHDGIRILSRVIEQITEEFENFDLLSRFNVGLKLLDDYDQDLLDSSGISNRDAVYPSEEEYWTLVKQMRSEFSTAVFGKEKDDGFTSALNQIKQSIGSDDIYPSIEEKAAALLYLIVKNHSFIDGNKRIGAACFLLFLDRNKFLYNSNGRVILSDEALASLTLFVALSNAEEMQTVKKLIISVLNRNIDK